MRPTISILHATFHNRPSPLDVKKCWLERAERPDLIEYIFAMDADDEATLLETEGQPRIVSPPGEGEVTAVRNWNAAAMMSSNDLLVVIADDLSPPQAWDTALTKMIGPLDAAVVPFAIKVADSPFVDDTLLRHPVVSRAFYRRFGLFSNDYRGVYCDNDITLRAFWQSVILDGRSLYLEHRHPAFHAKVTWTESQHRINNPLDYQRGRAVFEATWSHRHRLAQIRLVPVVGRTPLSEERLHALQRRNRTLEMVVYPYRRVKVMLAEWLFPARGSAQKMGHQKNFSREA